VLTPAQTQTLINSEPPPSGGGGTTAVLAVGGVAAAVGQGAVEGAEVGTPFGLPGWLIGSLIGAAVAYAVVVIATSATSSTAQLNSMHPHVYAADSNIFQDRPGKPGSRQRADVFLDDPDNYLIVCQTAIDEVHQTSSRDPRAYARQAARLLSREGGATIIPVSDPDLSKYDVQALSSANFTRADMVIVETARFYRVPLLTTNSALPRQITSNGPRRAIWGGVPIIEV